MTGAQYTTKKRSVRRGILLATAATAAAAGESSSDGAPAILRRPQHEEQPQPPRHIDDQPRRQHRQPPRLRSNARRRLSRSVCGSNWQDAYDSCNQECQAGKDEDCGPGRYCFGFVDCTPPEPSSNNDNDNGGGGGGGGVVNPWEGQYPGNVNGGNNNAGNADAGGATYVIPPKFGEQPAPAPQPTMGTPNFMPAYIASLPVRPSEPTTPAPFVLSPPTPNLKSNPTKNFCGYGWESAQNECYHACPSGKDDECPGGRSCHSWMTCTPAKVNPATYNVCGKNWSHAASQCKTRCFLGGDDTCPPGETCFGGVTDCGDKLPELTAEDVGLAEKTYTQEEIAELLDEEIAKERDEAAMADTSNWWCGTSWTNMLETCSKRCSTDSDCRPNAWDSGQCFKTTGGPDNCKTPGVPAKQPLAPGSRWCGSTWNDMLETCEKKCEADEDCGWGRSCWEAPDTCQWIGVPVKEKSDPSSLWCGKDYDDAMTGCHRACPGESDDECPDGMGCYAGSSCTEEGSPIVREGYRCGTSWDDASQKCGNECQSSKDCDGDDQCYAEVICESELEEAEASMAAGMFCGVTWDSTARDCAQRCDVDEDCDNGNWCYWVECEDTEANRKNGLDVTSKEEEEEDPMREPTTEATKPAGCSPEVRRCPNGQFVGRAQQLDCDFYPCPEDEGEDAEGGEAQAAAKEDTASAPEIDLSNWGNEPLQHACASDGLGDCGLCQGDCNADDDCQSGLLCFSRGQGELTAVPGCVSGGDGDKAGMDYCYTPFGPETTTTTTTTASTTTTTTFAISDLSYARECTVSDPCNACEGDCDNSSHCQPGLQCFSRGVGSMEPVPGCTGLGVAGMDYCHDPNAPIIKSPTVAPTTGGCSAEVRACPGGGIVYRDPGNGCEFAPCPNTASNSASLANAAGNAASSSDAPDESEAISKQQEPVASPSSTTTSSPTYDPSSYYCGYTLDQVNGNCWYAKPCPSGRDNQCDGLEVCIKNTDCGSASKTTTTTTAATTATTTESADAMCDDLCLDILPSEFCPANLNLPNCLEVGLGEVCEADGECATDDALNNCGTYDIYARVVCGFNTPSQGDIMRGTLSPTLRPSGEPTPGPTEAPVTYEPTLAPAVTTGTPTVAPMTTVTTTSATTTTVSTETTTSASVSIADAIAANAADNHNTYSSMESGSTGGSSSQSQAWQDSHPSSPPAASFAYDLNDPGSGGNGGAGSTASTSNQGVGGQTPTGQVSVQGSAGQAAGQNQPGRQPTGSSGRPPWYSGSEGGPPSTADNHGDAASSQPEASGGDSGGGGGGDDGGWNFDNAYFTDPNARNSATMLSRIRWSGALSMAVAFAWMILAL